MYEGAAPKEPPHTSRDKSYGGAVSVNPFAATRLRGAVPYGRSQSK